MRYDVYLLLLSLFQLHHLLLCNRIVNENKQIGSDKWHYPEVDYMNGPEGFSTQFSIHTNSTVYFKIDPKTANGYYSIEIYRLGYYGGKGGRLIDTIIDVSNELQPPCLYDTESSLVDCNNWHVSAKWMIPISVINGIYVAIPISSNGTFGSYMPFIVHDITHASSTTFPIAVGDILFKTADTTWVAYNQYGGWNVYRGNGSFATSSRATKASYNRPFNNRLPVPRGKSQNFLFGSEYCMLYWLEKHGYNIYYASSYDIESWGSRSIARNSSSKLVCDASVISRYKILLSVGHDEYWTKTLRKVYEHARDCGVHLAFFSGNEVFWQIRWDRLDSVDNQDKHNDRVIVCHKETIGDKQIATNVSISEEDWTGTFMDSRKHATAVPQNKLTGQLFMVNGQRKDAMKVGTSFHNLRFWRNTILLDSRKSYVSAEGLLGYEWDVFANDCSRPRGLIPLSRSVYHLKGYLLENYGATYKGNGTAIHALSLYRHYSNLLPNVTSLVFGAGTIQWSWALSSKHDGDAMEEDYSIQQATINLFADMNDVQPMTLISPLTSVLHKVSPSTDIVPPSSVILYPKNNQKINVHEINYFQVVGTAVDAPGGGVVAGVEISFDQGQSWLLAHGRNSWHFRIDTHIMKHMNCSTESARLLHYLLSARKESNTHSPSRLSVTIMVRAIDDSGWIESIDTSSGSSSSSSTNVVTIELVA